MAVAELVKSARFFPAGLAFLFSFFFDETKENASFLKEANFSYFPRKHRSFVRLHWRECVNLILQFCTVVSARKERWRLVIRKRLLQLKQPITAHSLFG